MTEEEMRAETKDVAADLYACYLDLRDPGPNYGRSNEWDSLWVDKLVAFAKRMQVVGLRKAAYISDNFSKGYEISWWHAQTKNNIARVLCRDVAEKIREKADELEASPLNQNGGKP